MEAKTPNVAVLLSTYNGARFIEEQLLSLTENTVPFTLHWIDDHSTDGTRDLVRALALKVGLTIQEWNRKEHEGVPGTFFRLLEHVDADVYLFCDQDDIWQAGKIDATVSNLAPDLQKPTLIFSEPLLFRNGYPEKVYPMHEVLGTNLEVALRDSRLFMAASSFGHTQGFTRALRDVFMSHKEIAHGYAAMHDMWIYTLAVALGTVRVLTDAPTTLYRWHDKNVALSPCNTRGGKSVRLSIPWREHQSLRHRISRHAKGFILAAPTLPQCPRLDRLLSIAKLVATLDQRQSLAAIARLAYERAMWPNWRMAAELAVASICTSVSK